MRGIVLALSFVVVLNFELSSAKSLPSYIQRCKRTDPIPVVSKCVAQRAAELKPYLLKGIPEMKLPAIEPLHIPELEINTGNGTAVGLHVVATDIIVYGVKDFQIKEFIFDLQKPYMFLHLYLPKLQILSDFSFKGKVLLLEINSNGRGSLNITDVYSKTHHRKLSIVARNNMEYLNMDDDEIESINYASGSVYLGGLFKDNPELTEHANQALNDNFNEIGQELSPLIYESVRNLILGTVKPVFDSYSLSELLEE